MMLPILISVSVTPLSYFFCADAGAAAAARMVAATANVFTKSSSARFIESPPAGLGSRGRLFAADFLEVVCLIARDDSSRRGFPEAAWIREPATGRVDLSRKLSAVRRSKFYDTERCRLSSAAS